MSQPESSPSAPKSDWEVADRPAAAAVASRGIVGEFLHFAWQERWWWIIPSVVMLLALGTMLYVAQGSQIAPFFYALF